MGAVCLCSFRASLALLYPLLLVLAISIACGVYEVWPWLAHALHRQAGTRINHEACLQR